ncbi:hypothetical protein ACSUBI_11490 [Acinetobacter baumannii]|uniref:hypothetical protein n=1 Tax=Acinetobacter baumannii TaxID=470 RepID=UPI00062C4E03|nr:hypothetical protein [Acinetobacter baumannii]KKZ42937.1 hypothetical protein UN98_01435 [Acinetobacter baumannii]MDV7650476.1 hypothetical protein [Acinetobacter baumannii]TPT49273.1 hypothetical protein FJU63_09230 [Acinetobacter baumannii]SSO49190.1 Uncharacterised protein [Acinetobacter baumannii]HDU8435351.1 hypothetical protein [Acinetobacter baumannii]
MKIVYVDEERDQHDEFKRRLKPHIRAKEVEVISVLPSANINETIDEIISHFPDVLVCDWQLNAIKESVKDPIAYSGSELIDEFLKVRQDFPVYLNTALINDGIGDEFTKDVNIVFQKSENMFDESNANNLSLFRKMQIQSNKYKKQITIWENELVDLIKKSQNGHPLSDQEEDRLIELDTKLEGVLDKRCKVPADLKLKKNTNLLTELIAKTEELLSKVNSNDK